VLIVFYFLAVKLWTIEHLQICHS